MKLKVWMARNKVSDEDLATKIGVDRVTVNRMKRGIHLPSWPSLLKLAAATKKQVMPNDFLEAAAEKK